MKQSYRYRTRAGATVAPFLIVLLVLAALPFGAAVAQEDLSLSGYGRSKAGVILDDGSVFMLENTLDLQATWDMGGGSVFADLALVEREGADAVFELRELYLQYLGDSFDLRVGKQQVIWGKSDGVFITDLVSPKDLSRFLVPDFVELRGAVTGVRANGYMGNHSLDLVWVPLFSPTILPADDSIWAADLPFPAGSTINPADEPDLSLENGEYFAKYSYLGSSFDLNLMGGWFWNDTPAYTVTVPPPTLALQGEYYQSAAFGYGVASTVGPLVLRSEGAITLDKRYQGDFTVYPEGYTEKHGIQYLIGTDFTIMSITFGLQFIQDIILDYEDALMSEEFINTATIAMVRTFAAETVKLEMLTYIGLDEPDALLKTQLSWKMTDAFELFGGSWLFFGDAGPFGQYDDNDSVFAGAKVSF
ncbi:MAG: hypothetical protein RBT68_06010 [Spirochaetia bacterium]|nr:hypothetical protein [Spirochaetia bacterium]